MTIRENVTAHHWRDDIDSLGFHPDGHAGLCVVHRRAFRTLLGLEPLPADCSNYFEQQQTAFQNAALAKIQRAELPSTENFHLNSRDIARELN